MSRSVANEKELLQSLRENLAPFVELKIFKASNFKEDVAVFQQATVVIGPHGGSFGNLAFLLPGSHVVEFLPIRSLKKADPGANVRPCYLGMAYACTLHYWNVEAENFDFEKPGMIVNISEALSALRHIGVLANKTVADGLGKLDIARHHVPLEALGSQLALPRSKFGRLNRAGKVGRSSPGKVSEYPTESNDKFYKDPRSQSDKGRRHAHPLLGAMRHRHQQDQN